MTQNADGSVAFSYDLFLDGELGPQRFVGSDTIRNVELFTFADGLTKTFSELFNDAPTDILLAGGSVAENAPAGTLAATLSAVDPDGPGEQLAFSLLDDAGGRFVLSGSEIRVAADALLDFETATSHEIEVRVTDQGGLFRDETFSIAVANVAGRTIVGTNRAERGASALAGTGEEDIIRGLNGNDDLNGLGGDDALESGNGEDVARGGAGDDSLAGGRGLDLLFGEAGDDRLDGGAGADWLSGGPGDDIFVFERGSGPDVIADFTPGGSEDSIQLSGFSALSFDQILSRTFDVLGSAVVALNGGQMVLLGVGKSELTANDFDFV
jgi:Ca2+-binding RTX toxin-like protein